MRLKLKDKNIKVLNSKLLLTPKKSQLKRSSLKCFKVIKQNNANLVSTSYWSRLNFKKKLLYKYGYIKRLNKRAAKVYKKWIEPEIWRKMSFLARRNHKQRIKLHRKIKIINSWRRHRNKIKKLILSIKLRRRQFSRSGGSIKNKSFRYYLTYWANVLLNKSMSHALLRFYKIAQSRALDNNITNALNLFSSESNRLSVMDATKLYRQTLVLNSEDDLVKLYNKYKFYCPLNLIKKRGYLKVAKSRLVKKFSKQRASTDKFSAKQRYLKYMVLLRYRWLYRPKLKQFKVFKKLFKRSLKKYRKINKATLFMTKLQRHLPKLTGYSSQQLFKLWLPFRRNYRQYWSHTGAVQKFSQILLLTPSSLSVFLGLVPSFTAGQCAAKAGIFSVNGLTSVLTPLIPGDILQINVNSWKHLKLILNYQKWNYNSVQLQELSFLQPDYSTMMFLLVRWPERYETLAPSFLTERWIRYYVREFSPRVRKFKTRKGNWKIYKELPKR